MRWAGTAAGVRATDATGRWMMRRKRAASGSWRNPVDRYRWRWVKDASQVERRGCWLLRFYFGRLRKYVVPRYEAQHDAAALPLTIWTTLYSAPPPSRPPDSYAKDQGFSNSRGDAGAGAAQRLPEFGASYVQHVRGLAVHGHDGFSGCGGDVNTSPGEQRSLVSTLPVVVSMMPLLLPSLLDDSIPSDVRPYPHFPNHRFDQPRKNSTQTQTVPPLPRSRLPSSLPWAWVLALFLWRQR